MNYSDNEKAIIWLDGFAPLSKEQKLRILRCTRDPASILRDVTVLKSFVGREISEQTYTLLEGAVEINYLNSVLSSLEKSGTVAVTCMSDDYPDKLLSIDDPPLVLYCKGNIGLLNSDKIFAIVGSRKTLPAIISKAEEFSKEISESGVCIITGLAEGVDSAAIRGAMDSGGIISFLPGGFNHVYPQFNRSLFESVCKGGLAVSEYNPNVVSRPYFFPERNRLIAALSDGVLVCSAGKKSGTSYTADYANTYGRTVFAFPYSLGVPSGEGCNALIKEFACLCDSVDDIYLSLGVSAKKKDGIPLKSVEQKVFDCIKEGEIHIDLLLQKTGMKIFEINPVLTMLEIKKYIVKNPGNTYSSIK